MQTPNAVSHLSAPAGGAEGDAAEGGLVYPTIFAREAISHAMAEHCFFHEDERAVSLQRFKRDVVITKEPSGYFEDYVGRSKGAVITKLTHQARMRMLHFAKNCNASWKSLPCFTYPKDFPRDGRKVKRDRKLMNEWLRRTFYGIKGMWAMEFQRRGAPHFHDLTDIDLESFGPLTRRKRSRPSIGSNSMYYNTNDDMEKALAAAWYHIVGSGDPKHLKAGVSWEAAETEDGAMRYIACHASKPHQKEVPEEYTNVGRFWGKYGPVFCEGAEPEDTTTQDILYEFGHDAISSKGKIKKYIWDPNER